ncbi:hypothetical protein PT974_10634 [Cladobotryum mycophilum]|uniref:Cell division protein n=1 Tax=Cladobotryum mycophilum TaxID=491253 RepID=A0ABR0SAX4_9HYPO
MSQRLLLRAGRPGINPSVARFVPHVPLGIRFSSAAPAPVTITDGSFWRNLIPKPLRKDSRHKLNSKKKKEWNPATYFIVMFLFIGSMSIQMLALRHQTERYMRQSSLRIAQLREVVQKIQNGEDVDVEKLLGTGDPQKEAEWEEVLQAIEQDEAMRKSQKQEKSKEPEPQIKMAMQNEIQQPSSEPAPNKTKTANFGNFF